MLDNDNYLDQFNVNQAFIELEVIFSDTFLKNIPQLSVDQATFRSPYFDNSTKLAFAWLKNTNFQWQKNVNNQILYSDEKISYQAFNNSLVEPWHRFLTILQIGGVNIQQALNQNLSLFQTLASANTSDNQAKQLALYLAGKISFRVHRKSHR